MGAAGDFWMQLPADTQTPELNARGYSQGFFRAEDLAGHTLLPDHPPKSQA